MRAPPESFRPMTGAPFFMAISMILQIFSGVDFAQAAAKDGEILREDIDEPAIDRAPAGDDLSPGIFVFPGQSHGCGV